MSELFVLARKQAVWNLRRRSEHRLCVAHKTGGRMPKGMFAPFDPPNEKGSIDYEIKKDSH